MRITDKDKIVRLNEEGLSIFFELMSETLVGFKNAARVYHDSERFNELMKAEVDKFLTNDKTVITDISEIIKLLDRSGSRQIVLISNPDYTWKYDNKVRDYRFGLALETEPFETDSDDSDIGDGCFNKVIFGDCHSDVFGQDVMECIVDRDFIECFEMAIIPFSHQLMKKCLRQVELCRYVPSEG